MNGSVLVDLLLVVVLISFLVYGFRSGFLRALGGILGFTAGGIAAFLLVPVVGGWITDAAWRAPAMLVIGLLLVLGGLSIGLAVGRSAGRGLRRSSLGVIDRLLGGVLTTVTTALVISLLAFGVGSLGVPFLSPAVAGSRVVRTIDAVTPDALRSFVAQARSAVVDDGLPRIVDAFSGPAPDLPADAPTSPELAAAAESVVRITGTAYACGQNQSGSGFVAAENRVITNAHVVAGVVEPMVQSPDGQALPGRVVYFDPAGDLAVIRVDGLSAVPLTTTGNLPDGATAVTNGYPFGGPFDADPAVVISVTDQLVADIYGADPTPRRVYTLASDVRQGESGGPLLSTAGQVAGVVFARAADTADVGYAIAMDAVQPVVDLSGGLVEPVASGNCAGA